MIKGIGIAIRGLGKALKKDQSTPIISVKPETGLKKTKEFLILKNIFGLMIL